MDKLDTTSVAFNLYYGGGFTEEQIKEFCMTRDIYDKATVSLDRFNKLTAIRDKIKREFPEFEYDQEAKEIGNAIFKVLEARIKIEADEFGKL